VTLDVGGVRLKTPVMAASGTFGYGTEVPLCDRAALGGMVSKGIFLKPRPGTPPPRIVETPSGMLNAIGLQGPGVEALIRDYAPLWATWDFPVLVNVNGESVDEYAELAARQPRHAIRTDWTKIQANAARPKRPVSVQKFRRMLCG